VTRHALATARLDLLPSEPKHADATWPYLKDERMWEFFPALRPPTIEALRQRYERWSHEMPYLGAVERWENWICVRREDDAAIGEAQLTYAGTTAYVAYGIFVPFRRHGFAREAIREALSHAASAHGASRAIAEMATRNVASVGVAEALGFQRIRERRGVEAGLGYDGAQYVYRLDLR
jgi:RimJ/RimL family protein N-acetyltransferase